jgi:hypothetical protein
MVKDEENCPFVSSYRPVVVVVVVVVVMDSFSLVHAVGSWGTKQ